MEFLKQTTQKSNDVLYNTSAIVKTFETFRYWGQKFDMFGTIIESTGYFNHGYEKLTSYTTLVLGSVKVKILRWESKEYGLWSQGFAGETSRLRHLETV